jgi:predicted Ser/Thr protein kinase
MRKIKLTKNLFKKHLTDEVKELLEWSKKEAKNQRHESARLVSCLLVNGYTHRQAVDVLMHLYHMKEGDAKAFVGNEEITGIYENCLSG